MLARVYLRLARLVHWQMGMASSRRDVLSRLQPLLQVVILAFGLFCLGIAQDVFIPIALAMLLTFVLSPIVERLQHYFLTYKFVPGRRSKARITSVYDRDHALNVVRAAMADYEDTFGL